MYVKNICHTASPSLAGQSAVKTGSSPDFASSLIRSSQFLSDFIGFTQHYSGGTVPVSHRSSLLSFFKHLFFYSIFNWSAGPLKKLFTRTQRESIRISFPSLVGQTVIPNRQFSWLCFFAYPVFPISQWHIQVCSALQWRDRAGFSPVFPIKLFQAPVYYIQLTS